MARVRMVTRTVEVTVANVMEINVETAEVKVMVHELTGNIANSDDILKALNKTAPENIKYVSVQSYNIKEVLYGMPEADFIRLAEILPPRF